MYLSVQKNSKRPSLLDVHLKYEHLSEQYVVEQVSSWEDLKNTASRSSVNRSGGCGVWKN